MKGNDMLTVGTSEQTRPRRAWGWSSNPEGATKEINAKPGGEACARARLCAVQFGTRWTGFRSIEVEERCVLFALRKRRCFSLNLRRRALIACLASVDEAVVVVGLGQLGSLFSEGFLRAGVPVVPVLRDQSLAARLPAAPRLVLVAVGENDVKDVLLAVPDAHLDRVVLIQNELRKDVWGSRYAGHVPGPSVGIVWFERKLHREPHVVLPTVLCGSASADMALALGKLSLPTRTITDPGELSHQLALKNLYILGLNFAGLSGFARAKELLDGPLFWQRLVDELINLEQASVSRSEGHLAGVAPVLDRLRLKADLKGALAADPEHVCAGRSAPLRLMRTLKYADQLAVDLVECRRIANNNRI